MKINIHADPTMLNTTDRLDALRRMERELMNTANHFYTGPAEVRVTDRTTEGFTAIVDTHKERSLFYMAVDGAFIRRWNYRLNHYHLWNRKDEPLWFTVD